MLETASLEGGSGKTVIIKKNQMINKQIYLVYDLVYGK